MSDLAFYNVGCQPAGGPRALVVLARRAVRRILRPIFVRQVELFQSLCDRLDAAERSDVLLRNDLDQLARRHDDLADQMRQTIAFGWDYVALVRRVAVLEDRVEALSAREPAAAAPPANVRVHGPHPARHDAAHADASH